jgi:hypothetical protein
MFDLADCVKTSRRFYRDHDLLDWARAIPKAADAALSHDSAVAPAEKAGFTRAFAFPPFVMQMEQFGRLIEATARRPTAQLSDNEQYSGQVSLSDAWSKTPNGKVLQRDDDLGPRTAGPYLLLFSPNPYATAWGRTGMQIQELFHAKGWHGLTVPEYLVLQRQYAEQFGDHRFFAHQENDGSAYALWLIDSMKDGECSVVAAGPRGIDIRACSANNRDARRATVAGMVLQLTGRG